MKRKKATKATTNSVNGNMVHDTWQATGPVDTSPHSPPWFTELSTPMGSFKTTLAHFLDFSSYHFLILFLLLRRRSQIQLIFLAGWQLLLTIPFIFSRFNSFSNSHHHESWVVCAIFFQSSGFCFIFYSVII